MAIHLFQCVSTPYGLPRVRRTLAMTRLIREHLSSSSRGRVLAPNSPHPEEPRRGVSKDEGVAFVRTGRPHGSRRRFAAPHHEGIGAINHENNSHASLILRRVKPNSPHPEEPRRGVSKDEGIAIAPTGYPHGSRRGFAAPHPEAKKISITSSGLARRQGVHPRLHSRAP